MPKAEGKTLEFKGHEEINPGLLEALAFEGKEPQFITYDYPEFQAVCPFSGLPDIARVIVEMVPRASIPELKALKYYYISFRQVGIYQEEATDRIFTDLMDAFTPKYLKVTTVYNTRGGLNTTSTIVHGSKEQALARPIAPAPPAPPPPPNDSLRKGF